MVFGPKWFHIRRHPLPTAAEVEQMEQRQQQEQAAVVQDGNAKSNNNKDRLIGGSTKYPPRDPLVRYQQLLAENAELKRQIDNVLPFYYLIIGSFE
jgi:hypothetical protein